VDWIDEVRRAEQLLHPAGFLMSHDELRVVNQCALCQSKHLTPGELLAWNVKSAAGLIRVIRPDAEIWVWNDMFDPMHDAVDNCYAVNGSLEGSGEGLNKDIGIVNWHGGLQGRNCKFFADRGHKQILAGYYDHDEDGHEIAKWLGNTRDVPGIIGAMYTTWENRYDAMATWPPARGLSSVGSSVVLSSCRTCKKRRTMSADLVHRTLISAFCEALEYGPRQATQRGGRERSSRDGARVGSRAREIAGGGGQVPGHLRKRTGRDFPNHT
jgi:hypothetical protein